MRCGEQKRKQALNQAPRKTPSNKSLEIAARGLCRLDGCAEDETFEGSAMWETYIPRARVILEAAQANVSEAINRIIH